MRRIQYILGAGITTLALALGLALPNVAVATTTNNVTICHRTKSVKNPYIKETVDESAVDGQGNNDHYGEHQGPLVTTEAEAQALKDAKQRWGDIIPPVVGFHAGLNWTVEGQIIYNNNCNSAGVSEVVPAAATSTAPTCSAQGSYTVPTTEHVDYKVGANVVAAGTYPSANGTTVTVNAEAQQGFFIADGTTDSWTFTFVAPSGCGNVLADSTTAQVTAVPTGGVGAGGGGAASPGAVAGVALLGSSATLGLGLFLRRWNA